MSKLLTWRSGDFWEQPDEGKPPFPCVRSVAPPPTPSPCWTWSPSNPPHRCFSLPPAVSNSTIGEAAAGKTYSMPTAGLSLPGYEILEDLGRTATGIRLYRAKQAIIHRQVLLSVVLAREDASQHAWAARGAASALGKLPHPNIVLIHEAGERERQLFYNATQLVDGPTLAQKVAGKPLPFHQIVRLMELLALRHRPRPSTGAAAPQPQAFVGSAAARGPVRDGPLGQLGVGRSRGAGCLLHSAYYIPRLTDFGLWCAGPSRAIRLHVDLYGDQTGYLSPEQAWGRSKDIGPTTDVYALGGILYFLLTGRPPFRGPTLPDTLDTIQTADLVPPAAIRSVPADLNNVCCKCLARQPRRRDASAGDLADDLRRAELGLPLVGRPPTGAARFGKWLRRRPAVAALIVVLVLGLVGTVTAYFVGVGDGAGGGSELIRTAQRPVQCAERSPDRAPGIDDAARTGEILPLSPEDRASGAGAETRCSASSSDPG